MDNNTILIIDEDVEFAASLTSFLHTDPAVEKVLLAVTRESAEAEIICHSPDFIIADLAFIDIDKILYYSECNESSPFILMTGFYDDYDYLQLSREIGANAFCLKDDLKEALIHLMLYVKKGIYSSVFRNKYYLLR